ncbi:MAG TPA: GDP-mannose 4,6-dehydratase [Planctomycetia bacterium]|nr:GDP-mannose 4,6-dehydratase [Planctomycetia bacterium]
MNPGEPKRYLITGGAGFIGSHLAELLLAGGARVTALDDLSSGSRDNLAGFSRHENFQFVRASLANAVTLDRLVSQVDAVIHLAAAVGVRMIVERPVHTIETNVMGTEFVLKAALRYGARVLIASTSEVYGKGSRIPFAEDDDVLLGATSRSRWSYAASKMVDEFLGLAYHAEFGLEVIPFRLFNTVGPRQTGRYGMVIPRFVQRALANEPLEVHGDGEQSRCFCDVRDVVAAIAGLAKHPAAPGRVFNIGGKEEIGIAALARRIIARCGSNSGIKLVPYDEAYPQGFEDMRRRAPDCTRIEALLGWKPRRELDEILDGVIAFERERLSLAKEPGR